MHKNILQINPAINKLDPVPLKPNKWRLQAGFCSKFSEMKTLFNSDLVQFSWCTWLLSFTSLVVALHVSTTPRWYPRRMAEITPCYICIPTLPNHCEQNMGFGLFFYLFQALGIQLLSSYSLPKRKKIQLVPKTPVLISQSEDHGH